MWPVDPPRHAVLPGERDTQDVKDIIWEKRRWNPRLHSWTRPCPPCQNYELASVITLQTFSQHCSIFQPIVLVLPSLHTWTVVRYLTAKREIFLSGAGEEQNGAKYRVNIGLYRSLDMTPIYANATLHVVDV